MAAANSTAWARAGLCDATFPSRLRGGGRRRRSARVFFRFSCSASSGSSGSYLDMWKKAVDREQRTQDEGRGEQGGEGSGGGESLEKMTERFNRIQEVPKEERDRAQRLLVIDRAAAAIAAARALVKDLPPAAEKPVETTTTTTTSLSSSGSRALEEGGSKAMPAQQGKEAMSEEI